MLVISFQIILLTASLQYVYGRVVSMLVIVVFSCSSVYEMEVEILTKSWLLVWKMMVIKAQWLWSVTQAAELTADGLSSFVNVPLLCLNPPALLSPFMWPLTTSVLAATHLSLPSFHIWWQVRD